MTSALVNTKQFLSPPSPPPNILHALFLTAADVPGCRRQHPECERSEAADKRSLLEMGGQGGRRQLELGRAKYFSEQSRQKKKRLRHKNNTTEFPTPLKDKCCLVDLSPPRFPEAPVFTNAKSQLSFYCVWGKGSEQHETRNCCCLKVQERDKYNGAASKPIRCYID